MTEMVRLMVLLGHMLVVAHSMEESSVAWRVDVVRILNLLGWVFGQAWCLNHIHSSRQIEPVEWLRWWGSWWLVVVVRAPPPPRPRDSRLQTKMQWPNGGSRQHGPPHEGQVPAGARGAGHPQQGSWQLRGSPWCWGARQWQGWSRWRPCRRRWASWSRRKGGRSAAVHFCNFSIL